MLLAMTIYASTNPLALQSIYCYEYMPYNLLRVKIKMSDKVDNQTANIEKQKNSRPKAKNIANLSKALKANLQRRKAAGASSGDKKHTPYPL